MWGERQATTTTSLSTGSFNPHIYIVCNKFSPHPFEILWLPCTVEKNKAFPSANLRRGRLHAHNRHRSLHSYTYTQRFMHTHNNSSTHKLTFMCTHTKFHTHAFIHTHKYKLPHQSCNSSCCLPHL